MIKDHKNDTLIYFNSLYLSPISLKKMMSSDLNFKSIEFEGLKINIFKYLSENENSLQIFLNKLNIDKKESEKKESELNFIINEINGFNSEFLFKDFNSSKNNFKVSNINLDFSTVNFLSNQIDLDINSISFEELDLAII